jgi:hypothetical protein
MDALPGSSRRAGRPLPRPVLCGGFIPVLTISPDHVLDDIHEAGDRSKDHADDCNPGLMKVLVRPCADEPADYDGAGKNERDLDAGFRFDDRVDPAGTLRAGIGIRQWSMERHPLVVIHDAASGREVVDVHCASTRSYTGD